MDTNWEGKDFTGISYQMPMKYGRQKWLRKGYTYSLHPLKAPTAPPDKVRRFEQFHKYKNYRGGIAPKNGERSDSWRLSCGYLTSSSIWA
jgi:hypothetical protein